VYWTKRIWVAFILMRFFPPLFSLCRLVSLQWLLGSNTIYLDEALLNQANPYSRGQTYQKMKKGSHVGNSNDKSRGSAFPVLERAPPPWHTQLVVGILFSYFVAHTPAAIASMDEIAKVETFTQSLFPSILSIDHVIFWRFTFAGVLLSVNFHDFFLGNLDLPFTYYPNSKLKPTVVKFRGLFAKEGGSFRSTLLTNVSFSNWAVGLLGFSFFLNGLIPFGALHFGWDVPQNLLRLAILAWTMAAPSSFLVSLVVKYVLWAHDLAQGEDTSMYKKPFILISHNANSIASLAEVGILGGLPCRFKDFAAAPMFGLVYIFFTWFMMHRWTEDTKKDGPQFLYPFFDTTLGQTCSIAIIALFLVLVASFCLFSLAEHVLTEYIGGGIVGHGIAVSLLCASVCRFQD